MLLIHTGYIRYQPKRKALKSVRDVEKKEVEVKDVLVAFSSFEKDDEKNPEGVAKDAAKEIVSKFKEVKAKNILLYPFAHLSSSLASPSTAQKILNEMESILKKKYKVHVSPFGFYKTFELKCLGHPLAEAFKEIHAERPKKEKEITGDKFHRFIIIDKDENEYEITKSNWKNCKIFKKKDKIYELLKFFIRNELEGNPPKKEQPKHINYMRKLELVDYCPESDVGHMKFYPNGVLIKDLMLNYAWENIALPWGAMKMQNPSLYRTNVEEIKKLQGEFHERDYLIESDNLVLRFASDPGAFPFIQKVTFTYKNMPVKIYEEAVCFRREQKGELSGLMRVRNFLMTDQHAFCQDEKQAEQQYEELSCLFAKLMNEVIAKDYWVMGFEIVEEFYEKYKNLFKRIVKKIKVPAFFKLMKKMTHYYAFKNEYQAIFPDGNNLQISTVQWDVKNGERFNICYVDEEGKRIPVPIIIHASSFGSIERALAAILETAAWMEKEGKPPTFPLWISPTQVRIIPVSDKHVEDCKKVLEKIESEKIRVDIDDRKETVQKKIRDTELEWVPYILVIGPKEIKSKKVSVRIRKIGKVEVMELEELIKQIKDETKDKPFRQLPLPKLLSERPIFVG